MTRFRRRLACDSGAEFVEFALAFPLLLLLVLGIIDFGLLFQQYEVITNAAREGARVAVLPDYEEADAEQRVRDYLDASLLVGRERATLTVGAPTAVSIGGNCMTTVTVTVQYPHDYLFVGGVMRYFGRTLGTKHLTAVATMRTEVAAAGCP